MKLNFKLKNYNHNHIKVIQADMQQMRQAVIPDQQSVVNTLYQ
jgi:hypothetical protein